MMLLRKVLFHPALVLDHMRTNKDQSKVSIGAQDINACGNILCNFEISRQSFWVEFLIGKPLVEFLGAHGRPMVDPGSNLPCLPIGRACSGHEIPA